MDARRREIDQKTPLERVAEAIWRVDHPEPVHIWETSADNWPGSISFLRAMAAIKAVVAEIGPPTETPPAF